MPPLNNPSQREDYPRLAGNDRWPEEDAGRAAGAGLLAGDEIFHPKYGFGTVHSLLRRDRIDPIHQNASAAPESDHTEDYYEIYLAAGGTLMVPVGRAEGAGLRRLSGSMELVTAGLCSPADSLPANFRERAAALRLREQGDGPAALIHSVRDMLAQSRGRALSRGEQIWLDKSCQRLSTEAALVDRIPMFQARAAILEVVSTLRVY
jgi:RNA polymerase-interacting CarD/CdnL/TRCF family regulator